MSRNFPYLYVLRKLSFQRYRSFVFFTLVAAPTGHLQSMFIRFSMFLTLPQLVVRQRTKRWIERLSLWEFRSVLWPPAPQTPHSLKNHGYPFVLKLGHQSPWENTTHNPLNKNQTALKGKHVRSVSFCYSVSLDKERECGGRDHCSNRITLRYFTRKWTVFWRKQSLEQACIFKHSI